MSYVPGGQVMVDSAADDVGDPKQTRMRVMMANRIGDWVQRLSQRVRKRESRSFHNHESYITSAQPYFCEWSTARHALGQA